MIRPTRRRRLVLESLENRQVLSTATPSGEEQYLLELINQARTDPEAAAERIEQTIAPETLDALDTYSVNLQRALDQIADATPRPPVAWDADLAAAAEAHSADQIKRNVQSHYGPNGETLADRLDDAGYDAFDLAAENIISKARSEDEAMQAFLIDWNNPGLGHRKTIQQPDQAQPDLTEAGVAVVKVPTKQWNPFLGRGEQSEDERVLVTQVFGRPKDADPKVLGVVYRDNSGDDFYTEGEGIANASIRLENTKTGAKYHATSWSAGGYQVEVPSGSYRVTAENGGRKLEIARVEVGTENVKVDFDLKRGASVTPAPARPTEVQTPAPAAPKPTPKPVLIVSKPAAPPAKPQPTIEPVKEVAAKPETPTEEAPPLSVEPTKPTAPVESPAPIKTPRVRTQPRVEPGLPKSFSLLIRYRASQARRSFPVIAEPPTTPVVTVSTPKPATFRFWRV